MFRIALLSLFLFVPGMAQADYFAWKDAGSGLEITFPDTWRSVSTQDRDDVLRIVAPSDNAYPLCEVKVHDDRRYVIFPVEFSSAIQRQTVSREFWDAYLGEYEDYRLDTVQDNAGLGRGFASYAYAAYTQRDGTVLEARRAIMFASLYFDKLYVVECSALEHAYEDWHFQFLDVIKSVNFEKTYNEIPSGNYFRDFTRDEERYFYVDGDNLKGVTAY